MTDLIVNSLDSGVDLTASKSLSAYNDQYFAEMVKTHLTNASNSDEFYNKLCELKNEQKKTLLYMQELYEQKQVLKDSIIKSESTLNDLKSISYPINNNHNGEMIRTVSAYENRPLHIDENLISDNKELISRKPPLPQKLTSSTVTFELTNNSNDESNNNNIDEDIREDLKRIEKIWNEFKMDDQSLSDLKSLEFNNRFVKKRVKSAATKTNTRRNSKTPQYEWFPRVTIPEPFSMTIREQMKTEQKQLKLARDMQEEREKKIDEELKECGRKFKASPVPAHVYLPLYEKHKMSEELRKQKLKKLSQDYMHKVSKPFNLTKSKNNGSSLRERRHSFTEGQNTHSSEFTAQPLPEFYFTDEGLNEKLREEEAIKQLKSKIRAIELLKQSKLPHNMELLEKKKQLEYERNQFFIKEMNRLQKEAEEEKNKKGSFTKRKSYEIPDYDELYRKFVIELERKKAMNRKHTKVEPFTLSESRDRDGRCINDEENADESLKRPNSMARLNKSLSASMDAFPTKSTQSQKMRESINKEKVNEIIRRELQLEHIEKMKKLKEKKLHEQIQEKIKYDPKEIDKKLERQTRKLKLEQRAREEEYEHKISELNRSMDSRKLQIEQFEENKIRKAIEKKYQDVLKKAGLTEFDLKKSENVARQVYGTDPSSNDWINE